MSASKPGSAASATDGEALQGLAQVLDLIASGLLTQGDAARQVATLAGRAEQLAAQAWELGRTRFSAGHAARDLAEGVAAFVAEAGTLTRSAAQEAGATREVAQILANEATELNTLLLTLDGVNDKSVIRAQLRPMLDTLEAVPLRLAGMTEVATDVAQLGDRARDLSDFTDGLRDNTWGSGAKAVAIYRELRDFADSAATIVEEMSAADARVRQSIVQMSEQVRQLATPVPPTVPARTAPVAMEARASNPPPPLVGMIWKRPTDRIF